jgi:hypothetical protein
MLVGVDGEPEPGPPAERRREIGARLEAIRTRLNKLRERDRDAIKNRSATPGERVEAAQRHAAEAFAAAAEVLASSVEAFRKAAESRTIVPPTRTREQQRRGSATWASTSGRQHCTGLLPQRIGSEPSAPRRFCPSPARRGLLLSAMSLSSAWTRGRRTADASVFKQHVSRETWRDRTGA